MLKHINNTKPAAAKSKKEAVKQMKVAFIAVFCILIFVAFILIEIFMRIAGIGVDVSLFAKPRYYPQVYVDNLNYSNKFFNTKPLKNRVKLPESMINNAFPVKKPKNTLRGFVIGESSVQGFPYGTNQSFAKICELALKTAGRYNDVEIINLGVSAMTSYYIRDAALKALRYEPDFILIYAGHNEYYGNVSYTTGGNYMTKRLYLFLKELRIFQLLFDLVTPEGQGENSKSRMEEQYSEKTYRQKRQRGQGGCRDISEKYR